MGSVPGSGHQMMFTSGWVDSKLRGFVWVEMSCSLLLLGPLVRRAKILNPVRFRCMATLSIYNANMIQMWDHALLPSSATEVNVKEIAISDLRLLSHNKQKGIWPAFNSTKSSCICRHVEHCTTKLPRALVWDLLHAVWRKDDDFTLNVLGLLFYLSSVIRSTMLQWRHEH